MSSPGAPEPEAGFEPELALRLGQGRLRVRQFRLLVCVGVVAGWMWLGVDGVILMAMWLQHRPPICHRRVIVLRAADVRGARLFPSRVSVRCRASHVEVFRDEINRGDWAALRRWLKGVGRRLG